MFFLPKGTLLQGQTKTCKFLLSSIAYMPLTAFVKIILIFPHLKQAFFKAGQLLSVDNPSTTIYSIGQNG